VREEIPNPGDQRRKGVRIGRRGPRRRRARPPGLPRGPPWDDDQFHFPGPEHTELLAGEALDILVIGPQSVDLGVEGGVFGKKFLAMALQSRGLSLQRVGADVLTDKRDENPPGQAPDHDRQNPSLKR